MKWISSPSWPVAASMICLLAALLTPGCGRDGFYSGSVDTACAADRDCAPGLSCEEGRCTDDGVVDERCVSGSTACFDVDTLRVCEGGSWRSRECSPGLCDEGRCLFEDKPCDDGQRQCADNTVYVCEDGRFNPAEVCARGLTCRAGACRADDARFPDLQVSGFSLSDRSVEAGQVVLVEAVLSNQGDVRMPSVECSLIARQGRQEVYLGGIFTEALDPGERQAQLFDAFVSLGRGEYQVELRCDPFNEVEELREDNNSATAPLEVLEVFTDEADLVVYYSEPTQEQVRANEPLVVNWAVGNESRTFIEGFYCSFQLFPLQDDRPPIYLGEWSDGFLDSGEVRELELEFFVPAEAEGGLYLLYTYCEPFQGDLNFSNNEYYSDTPISVEVANPQELSDLTVSLVDILNPFVEERQFTEVFFEVCNTGRQASSPTAVTVQAFSDQGDIAAQAEVALGRLRAGSCMTLSTILGPFFCGSVDSNTYNVEVQVDPRNRVNESNEFNNVFSLFGAVQVQCEPTVCTGDRFDFADAENPPLVSANEANLVMCPGDVDNFYLPLQAGRPLDLQVVLSTNLQGLMEVSLQGISANNVQTLGSAGFDGRRFSLQLDAVPRFDRYLLTVFGFETFNINRYSMSFSQENLGEVDLVADGITTLGPIQRGEPSFLEYAISNISMVGVNRPFPVGLYVVDGLEDDPAQRIFLARINEGGLGGGQQRQSVLDFLLPPDLQSELVTLVLVVDDGNTIAERSELNNVTTVVAQLEGGMQSCIPDMFEPNDTRETASEIFLGTFTGLTLCGVNRDFYRGCPPAGTRLDIRTQFNHSRGDLDMRLIDSSGRVVGNSAGTNNLEVITIESTPPNTCYTLEVFLFNADPSDAQTYDLQIDLGTTEPDLCEGPGSFEPNNDFGQAVGLEEAWGQELALCGSSDVDMYALVLEEGQEFTFRAEALDEAVEGDLSVTVYGPSRNFLTFRFARSVELPIVAATTGVHYFRVASSSAADIFLYSIAPGFEP